MQEIQPQGTGGQTIKNIKKDWNCGFWKRVSLSVFQSSFLFFVTIDMILGRHICFSQSCDLILTSSYFTNAEVHNRIANHCLKNEQANLDTAPLNLIWSDCIFYSSVLRSEVCLWKRITLTVMQWKPQTTPVHAVLLLFVLPLVWHSKLRTVKDNTMIKEGTRIDGSQQFKNTRQWWVQ